MGNLGSRVGIKGLGEASLSARSFYAPALTSSRGAANTWLRLRSFDLPALVFSTDQNHSGRRAAAFVEGRCAGADEGGPGGSAKRRAAGRPHRAPLRGRAWRGPRLKSTGSLWAGRKGASASEAVAEDSMVGRAKAWASARRGCCGSRRR